MSGFTIWDADDDVQNAPARQQRQASQKLADAISDVRDGFGAFLLAATGKDDFEDRWHYAKADVRAIVEPHVFPNTGTMNRIRAALKKELVATIGDDNSDEPTKEPKGGKDEPRTINDKQKSKIDKGDKSVTDEVETNTGDGSDAEGKGASSTTGKQSDPRKTDKFRDASLADAPNQNLQEGREVSDGDLIPEAHHEYDTGESIEGDFTPGGDSGSHQANLQATARLAVEMYQDWAKSNGFKVASMRTLRSYAVAGIDDDEYGRIASLIIRKAGDDCDCEDDDGNPPPAEHHDDSDSDDSEDSDSDDSEESSDDGGSESDSDSSDDSPESEDSGENPFAGGDDSAPADDSGSEEAGPPADDTADDGGFAGPPEGPQLGDDGGDPASDPAAVGDPATDDPGVDPAAGGDPAGPGDEFAIPDSPPDLSSQEQGMLPQDGNPDSSIPPELIDDILGLPPGTVEQLVMQEINGGGAPDDGGGDPGMDPGGPPPPPEDPRAQLARKLYAEATGKSWYSQAPKGLPAAKPPTNWDDSNGGVTKGSNPITPSNKGNRVPKTKSFADSIKNDSAKPITTIARRRYAEDEAGGTPDADPAAGGASVAPADPGAGAPAASPTQPGPEDGALLDQASQAVTQLVDTKTQEFQTVIDPLQQALQAIQFAQQVEQAANPLDVTPPEGTVDVGPGAQQPAAAPNAAAPAPAPAPDPQQQVAALQRHAFKLARHFELSERGYRMVLQAMSNGTYHHVADAIASLRDPQERLAMGSSMVDLFKQDNVRFNPAVFLSQAGVDPGHLASSPADRKGDSWADSKDRGGKEHEDYDTDPDNWEEREAHRLGLTASRRPFAGRGRRTAGETLKPATGGNTMDVFEAPGAGDQPQFTDNNKLTDLPKMKGPRIGSGVVDKYERFKGEQEKAGLGLGGDAEVENFFSTRGKGYKDIARNKVHQMEGITPHQKSASFFQPKVAGWDWNDHQNAYMTDSRKAFHCTTAGCNNEIDTPSQTMCKCGRLWYTYGIGDSGHLANNTGQLFIAREIPVRANVMMANRQFEADDDDNNASGEGPFQDYAEDVDFFADDELENAPTPHAPGETDLDTTRSAAYFKADELRAIGQRVVADYPDDHHVVTRDGEKFCSACDAMLWDPNVHHCPAKQAYRTADWTKFDDDDNAGYNEGPSGPPSTSTDPQTRKDWAKVDGKGRFAPSTFAK